MAIPVTKPLERQVNRSYSIGNRKVNESNKIAVFFERLINVRIEIYMKGNKVNSEVTTRSAIYKGQPTAYSGIARKDSSIVLYD
jgi:hypothetical protein